MFMNAAAWMGDLVWQGPLLPLSRSNTDGLQVPDALLGNLLSLVCSAAGIAQG